MQEHSPTIRDEPSSGFGFSPEPAVQVSPAAQAVPVAWSAVPFPPAPSLRV